MAPILRRQPDFRPREFVQKTDNREAAQISDTFYPITMRYRCHRST